MMLLDPFFWDCVAKACLFTIAVLFVLGLVFGLMAKAVQWMIR